MSKLTKRIIMLSVFLLVAGALAYPKVMPLFSSSSGSSTGSQQMNRGGGATTVEAVIADFETIEDRIFTSGSVAANEEVELSAEASGIITDIYFEEGREVSQGDLLLKINDSQLQAQKARTQFRLNLAEQREVRQARLLERGGISQDDYDATLNEVNVLRAEKQLIDAQIEQTEVRAPFNGIVGLKFVSVGSYISPNTRIASLQDIDPVKIDFSIPERFISRVNIGDAINFTVQGYDSTFTGSVYAIEPRIDPETRTLRIRALSGNPDRLLFPGAFANITLILEEINDALMLPSISVIPELNSQKVFLVRDGKVEESRIRTGIRTSEKIQVIEGVAHGDTVLTTGLLQVRPGMDVEIIDIKKTTDI